MCKIISKLCENGIAQLILMRHRPTSLQRSPLAAAAAVA